VFVRLARRLHRQEGMTLVELMVASALMSVVMVIFATVLASVQRTVVKVDNLSRANDDARLAVQSIDREVRSGNVLYEASDGGYAVKAYTQSNQDIRGKAVCKEWSVDDDRQLVARTWDPGDEPEDSSWQVVATGIVNKDLSEVAFALDADPLKKDRTLKVSFAVNTDLENHPTQTVRVQASITGRNTAYNYPVSICE
jgi:prepilin-type N-terminal cleavage/methylation domain-containing protein